MVCAETAHQPEPQAERPRYTRLSTLPTRRRGITVAESVPTRIRHWQGRLPLAEIDWVCQSTTPLRSSNFICGHRARFSMRRLVPSGASTRTRRNALWATGGSGRLNTLNGKGLSAAGATAVCCLLCGVLCMLRVACGLSPWLTLPVQRRRERFAPPPRQGQGRYYVREPGHQGQVIACGIDLQQGAGEYSRGPRTSPSNRCA